MIKQHPDKVIEQTKAKRQETLEFTQSTQMKTFSFSPPTSFFQEEKYLLALTSFEATNSVFNIVDENNRFSITIPGHLNSKSSEKAIDELNKFLELRSQNDIELHVEQVRKKGRNLMNDYSLSSLRTSKNEKLEELKNANYSDLQDMVQECN